LQAGKSFELSRFYVTFEVIDVFLYHIFKDFINIEKQVVDVYVPQ